MDLFEDDKKDDYDLRRLRRRGPMTTITTPEEVPELLLHHPTLPAACDRLLFTMKAYHHELPTPFLAKTVHLC